jgi:hypothetical protein
MHGVSPHSSKCNAKVVPTTLPVTDGMFVAKEARPEDLDCLLTDRKGICRDDAHRQYAEAPWREPDSSGVQERC